MLCGQAAAAAALGTEDHRDPALAAAHETVLGRLVDDLVDNQRGEIDEENLYDRPHAANRGPDAHAGEGRLRNRRIDHALRTEFIQQPDRDLIRPAPLADSTADQEHPVVAKHLLAQRLIQRLAIHHLARRLPSRVSSRHTQLRATSSRNASTDGFGLLLANSMASSICRSISWSMARICSSVNPPCSTRYLRAIRTGSLAL